MTQQYRSQVFSQEKWKHTFTKRCIQECSQQLYSLEWKNWRHVSCSWVGEWISKWGYLNKMECYTTIKKEQTIDTHNNNDGYQNITLSKRRLTERYTLLVFTWSPRPDKAHLEQIRIVVAPRSGRLDRKGAWENFLRWWQHSLSLFFFNFFFF